MHKTENILQSHFLKILEGNSNPWGCMTTSEEFNYRGGRTDIIALDNSSTLYAFEIKLEKWKIALNQAYRNTNFANKSYVILPKEVAKRALKYEYQFKRRSVGLCYIEDDRIVELLDSKLITPLIPWLNEKAKYSLTKSNEDS